MSMNRNDLQKKIQAISNLPTLPVVVMEINRVLQDYESSVQRLVELLEKDQSLVLKILKLVNSSFFGFKSKVSSLRHAVTLLGYNTIQSAVVAVAVIDTLAMKDKLNGFDIEQFWEHSIRVAVLSKYLAAKTRLAPAEDAFTTGLLHDIGKIILANFFPETLVEIIGATQAGALSFSEAEKSLDVVSHGYIGGFLAQRWMLPDILVKTIHYHHNGAERTPHPRLTVLVNLSDALVHKMAGEDKYQLNMDQLSAHEKNSMMQFLTSDTTWYKEVIIEMQEATSFFKRGQNHGE